MTSGQRLRGRWPQFIREAGMGVKIVSKISNYQRADRLVPFGEVFEVEKDEADRLIKDHGFTLVSQEPEANAAVEEKADAKGKPRKG
jgi:hypothetical protein